MKRVLRHKSAAEIALVRGILEKKGIPCMTKNEQLSSMLGGLPIVEQELWIIEDADQEPAMRAIEAHLATPADRPDWRCKRCGETNEGQFAACWQCGEADPGE